MKQDSLITGNAYGKGLHCKSHIPAVKNRLIIKTVICYILAMDSERYGLRCFIQGTQVRETGRNYDNEGKGTGAV